MDSPEELNALSFDLVHSVTTRAPTFRDNIVKFQVLVRYEQRGVMLRRSLIAVRYGTARPDSLRVV